MIFIKNYIKLNNRVKKAAALGISLVLCFSLAACYSGGTEGAAKPAAAAAKGAVAAASPSATQTGKALPDTGGAIRVSMPKNPATINPLKIKNSEMANLYGLIFESLVQINIDGRPEPGLAETWDTSADGKTWTFHLRQGINFHNGKPFTAADVVFTLDVLKTIAAKDSRYADCNSIISSYAADGDHTLKITTATPRSAVLFCMVFPVLSKSYYGTAADVDTKLPVGTGPYKMVSYNNNTGMQLAVNEGWWKTKPYITNINAVPYMDNSTALAGYDKLSQIDFVTTSLQTSGTYREAGKTEVLDYTTQYYDCLMPNITDPLFSDPNVRKALAYAIDKGDIISKALLNHAVAADFPVPPDSWLYDGNLKIYEYNTAKAQELLANDGWKDTDNDKILEKTGSGNELSCRLLVLKTDDITYQTDVANLLADQLKKMGFSVTVEQKSQTEYMNALTNGNFQLALCSFYMDRDPDLSFILGSSGAQNYSHYNSSAMDKLLEKCNSTVNEDKLKAAYGELQQQFVDDAPQVALYFRTSSLIYSSKIKGIIKLRELNVFNDISKWYINTKNVN